MCNHEFAHFLFNIICIIHLNKSICCFSVVSVCVHIGTQSGVVQKEAHTAKICWIMYVKYVSLLEDPKCCWVGDAEEP